MGTTRSPGKRWKSFREVSWTGETIGGLVEDCLRGGFNEEDTSKMNTGFWLE